MCLLKSPFFSLDCVLLAFLKITKIMQNIDADNDDGEPKSLFSLVLVDSCNVQPQTSMSMNLHLINEFYNIKTLFL